MRDNVTLENECKLAWLTKSGDWLVTISILLWVTFSWVILLAVIVRSAANVIKSGLPR